MKESFAVGADQDTGVADLDGFWFQRNVYPAEVAAARVGGAGVPGPHAVGWPISCWSCAPPRSGWIERLLHPVHRAGHAHAEHQLVPADHAVAGEPEPGQFRIGPHTDFGTVTVLDRDPGRGGLQVWTESTTAGRTRRTNPAAFTINTGDLLARWSGDRWKSNRHRVLPPRAEAPDEDLVSLVYFYEADVDAVVESLRPPIGKPNDYEPVESAAFIKTRLDAITVG